MFQTPIEKLGKIPSNQLQARGVDGQSERRETLCKPFCCLTTGRFQDPPDDRNDQTALFSQGDEFVRRNDPSLRVILSDQRLHFDGLSGRLFKIPAGQPLRTAFKYERRASESVTITASPIELNVTNHFSFSRKSRFVISFFW